MALPRVTIYTDGGASPNPGPGGWGAVLLFEKAGSQHSRELSGSAPDTTNNRMELTAALEALRALKQPCRVEFYTDSQYLKKGINEWLPGWKQNHFKGGKIQNVDLWTALDAEVSRHEINWHWVKGHAGDHYNERVDQLATAGRAASEQHRAADSADSTESAAITTRAYLSISCLGSPGVGGWAVLLDQNGAESILSGGHPRTSPNRLDLLAAIAALEAVPPGTAIQVFTPNSYLRDGITQWINGWKKSGWMKKTGGEVQYRNLWQHLDKLAQARTVQWTLLKNETRPALVDKLVEPLRQTVEAARQMKRPNPEPEFKG